MILSGSLLVCAMLLLLWAATGDARAAADAVAVDEGFEGDIPDLHTYQATYAGDDSRAHSGEFSLRVTPDGSSGGAYFQLDGIVDTSRDCEFSVWVNVGADSAARVYISASDGERRYTKSSVSGGKAGEWVKLTGTLRAEEWRETDCEIMLALTATTESWFDDALVVATVLPEPPIEVYPQLQALLRAEADARVMSIAPGETLHLDASNGAFAENLAQLNVTSPADAALRISPDGLLSFALDVAEPMYVTGSVLLKHGDDLRPGLRAYVLSDSTLVAAPMVVAPTWGPLKPQDAVPDIEGAPPPEYVELAEWLLPQGRRYLTVAGPHFRPAGEFLSLRIEPTGRPVHAPVMTFALIADTHVSQGLHPYMNVIMCEASATALPTELETLRGEGVDFALIAGDMVDGATRAQFQQLADALDATELPVYGCVGNHDAYHSSSRPDLLELLPEMFPGGRTDYVFEHDPLRFIVVDASYWVTNDGEIRDYYERGNYAGIGLRAGQLDWLRDTLAADTQTPTVVVWHYAFYNRGGESLCGFQMRRCDCRDSARVLELLQQAPNVVATLNGHGHWDEVNAIEGITHLQNAAFAEWPNSYRVLRVYEDHMEWEVRQVGNRGFARESFMTEKAQSWMITTAVGDLTGRVFIAGQ